MLEVRAVCGETCVHLEVRPPTVIYKASFKMFRVFGVEIEVTVNLDSVAANFSIIFCSVEGFAAVPRDAFAGLNIL